MAWIGPLALLLFVPGAVWVARRTRRAGVAAAARIGRRTAVLDLAGLVLLALAALGFFWRVVSGQNWMPADGGDLVSFLYPTYRFAAAALRSGAWPLWNPHLYAGAPHVADIQAGFLYPPNLVLFLLWPDFPYSALQWLSLAHIWWAGAGMFLFLRRGLRLQRLAALAGALAFMFSDAFLVHFGNLNFNAVASWAPWIFWAFLRALPAQRAGAPDTLPGAGGDRTEPESRGAAQSLLHAGRAGARIRLRRPARALPREGSAAAEARWSNSVRIPAGVSRRRPDQATFAYRYAALAGVLLAIATLAGHIQATLFILLALAVYSAVWFIGSIGVEGRSHRDSTPLLLSVTPLLLCLALTALLAAPILLPAFQLAGYTARATWNYQEAAGYAIAPAQWIGLLMPNFFGSAPQFHWSVWPRVEVGYVGILPLVLASLALALRRGRQTWAWVILACAAFVLALGPYALPHGWLTLLPGFGQLRAPARLVFVADLALAALAAMGLDAALRPLSVPARATLERVRRILAHATAAVAGIAVPLAYLALLLVQERDAQVQLRVSIALIAVTLCAGLLGASLLWLSARRGHWARPATLGWLAAAVILLDLGSNGAYQDLGNQDPSRGFSQPAIAQFLAAQAGQAGGAFRIDTKTGIEGQWQPDTALLYGLDDVGGLVNPLLLADAARYWEGLGSRSSRLYDLLNVRYVIAKKDVALDLTKFQLAFDGSPDLNVYANRRWLPRAFFVPTWQEAGSHEAVWQAIHTPGFDPTVMALVENDSGLDPNVLSPVVTGGQAEIKTITEIPNGLRLQVHAEDSALLVVSQVWYPGWQVVLDGKPLGQAQRVDYLFQGLRVPPGDHRVELRFQPAAWRLGWWLDGATLAALFVTWLLWARRRRILNKSPRQ